MSKFLKRFKIAKFLYEKLIEPKSKDEDSRRREFILNILLATSIALFGFAFFVSIYDSVVQNDYTGFHPWIFFAIFCGFLFLNFLSRLGFFVFSAYIFTGLFFALDVYAVYKWGVELPAALLFYVLTIALSSILIGTRFSFFATLLFSLSIIIMGYLEINNFTKPDLYWKEQLLAKSDILGYAVIFFIVAIVSWLSNREIEKSLARARKSEAELKKERDFLEIKVEERTKELRESQIEKMAQLSRFAEFGRLSSGLFHDLMNPLTAVSLNMEKIKSERGGGEGVIEAKSHLGKAIEATKKMEEFISAVRKQMSNEENKIYFSPEEEIGQIIGILSHKALKAGVEINFSSSRHVKTYGDVVKFNQAVANLATNAIDAYEGADNSSSGEKIKEVAISLTEEKGIISLIVKDSGKGIPKEHVTKIFDPFFTTKGFYRGIGIGLSLTKSIIEKDFRGTVEVESVEGEGAEFTIKFPKREEHG